MDAHFSKWALIGVLLMGLLQVNAKTTMERKNYQINGSFEYATNPDIPDYWAGTGVRYRTNGLPWELVTKEGLSEFREKFFLDSGEAYAGKKSIRVERPFHLIGMLMDVVPKKEYSVSAYVKSEFADRRIQMGVTMDSTAKPVMIKEVISGSEWKRFELRIEDFPGGKMSFFVKPLDTGKVWIDAVQIERGPKATAFVPSHYDGGFDLSQKAVQPKPGAMARVPKVVVERPVSTSVNVDGELKDAVWAHAPTVRMNDYMGAPTSVATDVKLAYDRDGIYLAFLCSDPGKAAGLGDSIEVFIDMLGIGDPYYQFIFDANGVKRNFRSVAGVHDWKWHADWDVKVTANQSGWTAEVAIPFSSIPDAAELARIHGLRMNFCRNYLPGPEKYLSWAPVKVGFLEPDRFGQVVFGSSPEPLAVSGLSLKSSDPVDHVFDLCFLVKNQLDRSEKLLASVCLESEHRPAWLKTKEIELAAGEEKTVNIPGLTIEDPRCRASIVLCDSAGKKVSHLRQFLDTPHPVRIYSEYSYYTSEKTARIAVELRDDAKVPDEAELALTLKLRGYPRKLLTKAFPVAPEATRQLLDIPISSLRGGLVYDITVQLLNKDKQATMKAQTDLRKYAPTFTEVKVNRLNRGLYLNGKPYIPYGIQVPYFERDQIRYYHKCGFDFINLISHWRGQEKNIEFMKNCEREGVNVISFHVARPNLTPPAEALADYRERECKALIGFVPNDEEGDRIVYDIARHCQFVYPEVVTCVNHNFSSYKAFDNRLREMPGDVLSIDRYPLLLLPKGRPQTTSEIYSVERCIELMDRAGILERKPLFFWMQGGERFAKEPTPAEVTWLTYILLANHCLGFTYFGGVPASRYVWGRVISLNAEIQALKPFLFSLEREPVVSHENDRSKGYIKVLPKMLGKTLVLVCVNRAMESVDAALDLSAVPGLNGGSAAVLFEKRGVRIQGKTLKDNFAPLARHVYKISLK